MSQSLKYRPEIDGLRCLAVLPVICFHINKQWLPGGYLGVDVFFVISGFLVTSIILGQLAMGHFSLLSFWQRRIKRLLPAAVCVLLVSSLLYDTLFYHPDLRPFSVQKIASLFSFSNIYFWRQPGGYFGTAAENSPFLHFWSLSVEEQYYFFYPVFLILLYHRLRQRLFTAIASITAISFVLFVYGAIYYPTATFYLLPTRVWQLGAGCLLAIAERRMALPRKTAGTVIGLLLVGAMYALTGSYLETELGAFLVVCGAVLIIASSSNQAASLILENKASTFIGRISYSLYLWHLPIIVAINTAKNYNIIRLHPAWSIPVIFAAGVVSYLFIETPFRRMKHGTPVVLCFVFATSAFCLFEKRTVLANSYSAGLLTPSSWHGLYYDLKPRNDLGERFRAVIDTVNTPPRQELPTAYKEGGIIRTHNGSAPRVVLLGDSHAITWCKLIDDITKKEGISTSLWAMIAVNPFFDVASTDKKGSKYLSAAEQRDYDISRLDYISRWKPDLVIFAARWESINSPSTRSLFDFLEQHSKAVLLVESPPALSAIGDRNFAEFISFLGVTGKNGEQIIWKAHDEGRTMQTKERIMELVAARKTFSFLPIADLYTLKTGVLCGTWPTVYYLDDDHLTDAGTLLAHDRFATSILQLLASMKNDGTK